MRKSLWLALTCLLAVVVVAGCGAPQPAAPKSPAAPATPKAPAAPAPAAPAPKPATAVVRYMVGSTSPTSSAYPLPIKMSELINKAVPEQQSTVVASGATHDNLVKLRKGTFHWATSNTLEGVAMAYQGIARDEYVKAGPWPELRIPFLQSILPIHFTVTVNSGVEKLEDLNGKSFSAGIAGSGAEYFTRVTLDALGIKPKYFMANYTDAVEAAKEGRSVGFAKYASGLYLDASEIDLMSVRPIRILNWTDKQMTTAMTTVPGVGAYRFQANEIKPIAPHPVINTPLSLIVEISTSAIPQDTGYKMWKTIIENWDAVVEVYAPAAAVNPALTTISELQKMAKVTKMPPLHAGTVQYLVEKGIAVPKELIPPEYKPVK